MSDFQKALKSQAKKPWVKAAELGEKSEGVRDAINAGRGNVVSGAKKLHYKKPGLKQALAKANKKGNRNGRS